MKNRRPGRCGGGLGKHLDELDNLNLVFFPTERKLLTSEDATAAIREIAFAHYVAGEYFAAHAVR